MRPRSRSVLQKSRRDLKRSACQDRPIGGAQEGFSHRRRDVIHRLGRASTVAGYRFALHAVGVRRPSVSAHCQGAHLKAICGFREFVRSPQGGTNAMRGGKIFALVLGLLIGEAFAQSAYADDGDRLLRLDHYVSVKSTVPAIAGQTTAIYVREVVRAGTALRNRASANPVVLFVHGAGTPGAV